MTESAKKTLDAVRKQRGRLGEAAVCRYLSERGYEILHQNYRKKCGEIDIIARTGRLLVIVEVKSRKLMALERGCTAVGYTKKQRIIRTTQMFMHENNIRQSVRFDIAEVTYTDSLEPEVLEIAYFEGAFDASGIKDLYWF